MTYTLKYKYDYKFRFIIIELSHNDIIREVATFEYIDEASNYINYLKSLKDENSTKEFFIIDMLETKNGLIDIKWYKMNIEKY